MIKSYNMIDLDCANCAREMEEAIGKIDGVKNVSINFLMQKITLEADESIFDNVMKKAVKACRRVEPDCRIEYK